jgi:putative ABC transport system substrate-binding protein
MRSKNSIQIKTISKTALLLLLLLGSLLLSSCNSEPEVYRVGILSGLDFVGGVADGFKAGMTELGYVEGENIVYDLQATNFDMEVYRSILQKFVEDEVDLIFVFPTEATLEAKAVSEESGIPVVFSFAQIEELGIVESVRQPGGNITGVRFPGPDLAIRRLELMQQMVPDLSTIWVPYQRGYPIVEPQLAALLPAAEAAGVTVIESPADNATELESILQEMVASGEIEDIDGMLFVAEPLAVTPDAFAVIAKYGEEYQIPMGGITHGVDGYDSIFHVNADILSAGEQAAPIADKVLQGTDPGTIPVVSADAVIMINFKQTEALGLEVPDGLLAMADEVLR